MCNATVERIVDCAHHHKIQSILELKKETAWLDTDQFGNKVIYLIQRHAAPPASPFTCTPLRPTMSSTANTICLPEYPLAQRKNKCSACGKEGHNARNKICVNHPSCMATVADKENVCVPFNSLDTPMVYPNR
ncbi:hypothetical protein JVT61DRAFT_8684 [Boletus reticuloceps]|uniref:Uncharacterized protein n=1 Tax=Boletus reticuloceps TaxID=495285 RepID=A0A8I2YYN3_9AGAM|nr:hypothetical protein JVT61DRAFT_8684 [Boletus reticuloceps]